MDSETAVTFLGVKIIFLFKFNWDRFRYKQFINISRSAGGFFIMLL
jgi:hypothetical protein